MEESAKLLVRRDGRYINPAVLFRRLASSFPPVLVRRKRYDETYQDPCYVESGVGRHRVASVGSGCRGADDQRNDVPSAVDVLYRCTSTGALANPENGVDRAEGLHQRRLQRLALRVSDDSRLCFDLGLDELRLPHD